MTINADTGPAEAPSVLPSLFDAVAYPGDVYNEAFTAPLNPRGQWQPLVAALDAAGPATLGQRQERVGRMRHEDGATFNPFAESNGKGIPWALEMIPLPITQQEWAGLEAGLIQRALLLETILADVYGPQNLLKEKWIPPALVLANPRFLRACHGIQWAGSRFLTYYAADIYRAPDGRFRVLRDYTANPAGLGYALENRIVISRVFSDLYHKTQIRRLAPFFQTFHRSLSQRAAVRREDPAVVLLSPGPDSRIYFEHALLSRYLGYPLVEGQDLTVRNGRLFLKKLAGLEPVEAVFRHIPDERVDPLALRRETAGGVAGLIQACREQNIDLINPVGSGFAATPVLSVLLPVLCRQLMGAELQLENHPSWWCGYPEGLDHVTANIGQLNVGPAMEHTEAFVLPDDLPAAVKAAPHAFMARERVRPAAVPSWEQTGIESRYALMRVFACATEDGFAVMPGGLAITAANVETLTGDCPERLRSKDIWVLSERPVEPFSLMGGLRSVPDFQRSSDLPSRVADHLLWLGRYLERGEGLIRLLRFIFRRLSGEAGLGDLPELPFLLNLLRAENIIPPAPDGGSAIPLFRELSGHLTEAVFRREGPESVLMVLKRVQVAARNVRDRLSLDCWRVINRLEGFADMPSGDPLELLNETLFTLSAFSGLAMESMTRGLGWRFMDMGRRVERAMNQSSLIRTSLPEVCTNSSSALEALLEISDSIMTYRARYRTAFQLAPVLDLLLVDEGNPKSLAFQVSRLAAHVEHLPRKGDRRFASAEERMALEMLTMVRLVDLSDLRCGPETPESESLAAFLTSIKERLKAFAQQISAHYLSRVPAIPHYSTLSDDRRP